MSTIKKYNDEMWLFICFVICLRSEDHMISKLHARLIWFLFILYLNGKSEYTQIIRNFPKLKKLNKLKPMLMYSL